MSVHEYCTGVPSPSADRCLHMAMFYRLHDHTTPEAHLTPISLHHSHDITYPSHQSAYPSPYSVSSPSPSLHRASTPPSPQFEALPPYSPVDPAQNAPRPTLPPISALFPHMGASASLPPPPPPPYTRETPPARFPVFHVRCYGDTDKDSLYDGHKLFVVTDPRSGNGEADGVYLHMTRRSRKTSQCCETRGNLHPNTPNLREYTLLGTIAAKELDRLQGLCRRVHADKFGSATKSSERKLKKSAPRPRVRMYTSTSPPPPYNEITWASELSSPSQEWVAVVIAAATAQGMLQTE